MSLTDIIEIVKTYLFLGLIFAFLSIALILFVYIILYKKIGKGTKKIQRWNVFLWVAFFVYFIVVLGATFGSRGAWYQNSKNLHLFSSYREAWNTFSDRNWRYLIFNILMFIPLGIFLPLLLKKCKSWKCTYFFGFVASSIIEILQFITHRGVFELDDIVNNTLGAIIGYGFVSILFHIKNNKNENLNLKQKSINKIKIICLQIPFFLTIVTFVIIFFLYFSQELGNLSSNYEYKVNMSQISVSMEFEPSEIHAKAMVYQTKKYTLAETQKFANDFFSNFNTKVDETQNIIYENTAFFYSDYRNKSISIDYLGLGYRFSDFTQSKKTLLEGLTFQEVKDILQQYQITVPDNTEFLINDYNEYQINYSMIKTGNQLQNGTIMFEVVEGKKIQYLYNQVLNFKNYREFEMMSEKEACEKIKQGKFSLNGYNQELKDIQIHKIILDYELDSKGFYQPVYVFQVFYNNDQTILAIIRIPAL